MKSKDNKQWKSFENQINLMQERGLNIDDNKNAENFLSITSYHRFNSYRFPFLNDKNICRDTFNNEAKFSEIVNLYYLDIKYKALLSQLVQIIEITFKTQLIYHFSKLDPYFYANRNLYIPKKLKAKSQEDTDKKFNNIQFQATSRSNIHIDYYLKEKFKDLCSCGTYLEHYYNCSCNAKYPPAWIALEGLTFGQLIDLYKLVKYDDEIKNKIANFFVISNYEVFIEILTEIKRIRDIVSHYDKILGRESFIASKRYTKKEMSKNYPNYSYKFLEKNQKTYLPYFLLIKNLIEEIISKSYYAKYVKEEYNDFL
jgi:abortive infection bacteriophage resistance protein